MELRRRAATAMRADGVEQVMAIAPLRGLTGSLLERRSWETLTDGGLAARALQRHLEGLRSGETAEPQRVEFVDTDGDTVVFESVDARLQVTLGQSGEPRTVS